MCTLSQTNFNKDAAGEGLMMKFTEQKGHYFPMFTIDRMHVQTFNNEYLTFLCILLTNVTYAY